MTAQFFKYMKRYLLVIIVVLAFLSLSVFPGRAQVVSHHPEKINCSGWSLMSFKTNSNHSKVIEWSDTIVKVHGDYQTTVVFNYNSNGYLISKKVISKDGEGVYKSKCIDYYYNNGHCVKVVSIDCLKDPVIPEKYVFYTYKDQMMDKSYTFFYENGKESLYECKTFEYDALKRLIYVGSYRGANGPILSLDEQKNYFYDSYGRIACVIDNLLFHRRIDHLTYSYDSQNRINKLFDIGYKYAVLDNIGDDFSFNYKIEDNGSSVSHSFNHSFKYDGQGHLVAVFREGDANRGEFEYDGKGRLTHMTLHSSMFYDIRYGRNSKTPTNAYLVLPVVSHNAFGIINNKISVFDDTKNLETVDND